MIESSDTLRSDADMAEIENTPKIAPLIQRKILKRAKDLVTDKLVSETDKLMSSILAS